MNVSKGFEAAINNKDLIISDLEAKATKFPTHEDVMGLYKEQGADGRREIALHAAKKGIERAGLLGSGNTLDLQSKNADGSLKIRELKREDSFSENLQIGDRVPEDRSPQVAYKKIEKKGLGAGIMKRLGRTQYEDEVMVYINVRNGLGGETDTATASQDTVVVLQAKIEKGVVQINPETCFSDVMSRKDFNSEYNSNGFLNSKRTWLKGGMNQKEAGNSWNRFVSNIDLLGSRFSSFREGWSDTPEDKWAAEKRRVETMEFLNGKLTERLLNEKNERTKLLQGHVEEVTEVAKKQAGVAESILRMLDGFSSGVIPDIDLDGLIRLSGLTQEQESQIRERFRVKFGSNSMYAKRMQPKGGGNRGGRAENMDPQDVSGGYQGGRGARGRGNRDRR